VLAKRISSGKTTSYYLELGEWGPRDEVADVSVSNSTYKNVEIGEMVNVYLKKGKLNIPWFIIAKNRILEDYRVVFKLINYQLVKLASRKHINIFSSLLLILVGCNQPINKHNIILTENYIENPILIHNAIYRLFSNNDKEDQFNINITGKSILQGEVHFLIKNSNGRILYEETFPASYLIGYGLIEYGLDVPLQVQEDYIKTRINSFFDEMNFIVPALVPTDVYYEEYANKGYWDDIQSDQSAVGFQFLIGEGNFKKIAFSKKFNKVVVYYSCC
jgi:hypothetical protein